MAPSLKEIDTAGSAAASGAAQGDIAVGAIHHPAVSASENSNAPSNNDADAAGNGENMKASSFSSRAAAVQLEDKELVPPDHAAFLHPPHFTSDNPLHRNLSGFDHSMRCAICGDLFRNPVMLMPCLHNFCSLCVRSHFKETYTGMKRKADCPQCHEPVRMPGSSDYNKGILPNKMLEQQVNAYKQCREPLRDELIRLNVFEQKMNLGILRENDGEVEGAKPGRKRGKTGKNEERGARASKRGRRAAAKGASYASEDDDDGDSDHIDDEDYVEVCDTKVSAAASASPSKSMAKTHKPAQLQPKPTVSYHGLNRKKLVELCKKERLETHGNEKELKQRHSDYITLHNSECDSENPRTVKELLKEVKSREKQIKLEANNAKAKKASKSMINFGKSLDAYHGGSVSRPTSGNEAFDAELDNGFKKLIANARKTNKKAPAANDNKETQVAAAGNVAQESVRGGFHGAASANQAASQSQAAAALPQQPAAETSESQRENDAPSPTASVDSDKTVETPRKFREIDNNREETPSPPSAKPKASTAKRASPTKKAKPSKSNSRPTGNRASSRVSSLGPWACPACTFENVRNTTRTAVCELCGTKRPEPPKQTKKSMEVVNIDC